MNNFTFHGDWVGWIIVQQEVLADDGLKPNLVSAALLELPATPDREENKERKEGAVNSFLGAGGDVC